MSHDSSHHATQAGFSGVAHLLRPDALILGRYRLKRRLGRGGFSVVWLAHDEELDLEKAVKFFSDSIVHNREALEEMKQEVKRGLVLTHPHIVRVHDVILDEELAGITMEYVDGGTFSDLKAGRPSRCFDVEHLAGHVASLCDALEYAHTEAKLVHRDLKPANLMLDRKGRLRIADFGISRSIAETHTRLTNTRETSGTLPFMSPQQLGGHRAQISDDIYAVGATLYDLLTSKPPFYTGLVADQIKNREAVSVTERRKELGVVGNPVPERWEEAIRSALSKRASDRPQSATELAERLGVTRPATYGAHARSGEPHAALAGETATASATVDPHAPFPEGFSPGGALAQGAGTSGVQNEAPETIAVTLGPGGAAALDAAVVASGREAAVAAADLAPSRPDGPSTGTKRLLAAGVLGVVALGAWLALGDRIGSGRTSVPPSGGASAPTSGVEARPESGVEARPESGVEAPGSEFAPGNDPPAGPTPASSVRIEPVPMPASATPQLVGLDWDGTLVVTGAHLEALAGARLEGPSGTIVCEVLDASAYRLSLRTPRRLGAGTYAIVLAGGAGEISVPTPLVVEPAFRWLRPSAGTEVTIGGELELRWEGNIDGDVRVALQRQGRPDTNPTIETVSGLGGSSTFEIHDVLEPGAYVLTASSGPTELATRSVRVNLAPTSVVTLLMRFRNGEGRRLEPARVVIDGREHVPGGRADESLPFDASRIQLTLGRHEWQVTDRFGRTYTGEFLVEAGISEVLLDPRP